MPDQNADKELPSAGTVIRAENGDIIRYDSTGLVMVLSDRVIADIKRRWPETPANEKLTQEWIDAEVLGNVDAWDVHRDGEWYIFTANLEGKQGVRQFRKLVEPDNSESDTCIIADAAGAVRGILSIGGSRRATGFNETINFPWHILAPADEIGAVGHAGVEAAQVNSALQVLPEMTRDAALADIFLTQEHKSHQALPLYLTRTETDSSASIKALAEGSAYANLLTTAKSLQAAAKRLDKRAVLLAIGLEFTLEDIESDAQTYRNGVLDLLAKLTRDLAVLGFRRPPFLSIFDCGTHTINDHLVLRAQWDLAWQGSEYGLCYTAPGYMFRQDRYGRPDMKSVWQMAEMDACALEVLLDDDAEWLCPIFLLAEREPDNKVIRVKARTMGKLVIDTDDPFGSGKTLGFSLAGTTNAAKILHVAIAENDPEDILLTCDVAPEGDDITLLYAFGNSPKRGKLDFPAACGALRDEWSFDSKTGQTLHRWALPAALPVH